MELISRKHISNTISLGTAIASALMAWKVVMLLLSGSKSPMVVVVSGSMEPGIKRGDILLLRMNKDPIRTGEIVVFDVEGQNVPIVHRVITVHQQRDSREANMLTKGDNNPVDDRSLYAPDQYWLENKHIRGRAFGFLPYAGWFTILLNEMPLIKYLLIGAFGLLTVMI